ncbi:MAG: sugar phosphate isomerase/epimerase [Clostridiales bacterium]|nr:sugar phosphate isomerase/epimerase [Clostridiales bacterium]
MPLKSGIQLYSVRNSLAEDPAKTIKKVAETGYRNLEAANHSAEKDPGLGFGISSKELKIILENAGAKIASAHIHPLHESALGEIIDYNLAIGNKNIVDPMETFNGLEDLFLKCEKFNRIGQILKSEGLRFIYHNHTHEFQTIGGKLIMDFLMERTDPALVSFELDTFWAFRAGVDPIELISRYKDRIMLLHQKDMSKTTKSPVNIFRIQQREQQLGLRGDFRPEAVSAEDFAEIGTGIMEIQAIIDKANEIGAAEYIILEQDFTQLPSEMESIRLSMEGFRKYSGINWD